MKRPRSALSTASVVICCAWLAPCSGASLEPDWVRYEDSVIGFRYPREWKIYTNKSPRNSPLKRVWTAEASDYYKSDLGHIRISENLDGAEKRSLEAIFASDKKRSGRMKVIEGPRSMNLPGAKCLIYKWDTVHVDVDWSNIPAYASAYCYKANGNYIEITTRLAYHDRSGAMSDEFRKNAAVFDRFLKGLEFKETPAPPTTRKEQRP